jgi:hypothetical protein
MWKTLLLGRARSQHVVRPKGDMPDLLLMTSGRMLGDALGVGVGSSMSVRANIMTEEGCYTNTAGCVCTSDLAKSRVSVAES